MITASKPCACGCGELRPEKDRKGRSRSFIYGHSPSGRFKRKIVVARRTSHSRANEVVPRNKCAVSNFDCGGPLEIAHIDGNELNNHPDNLLCLCKSHHNLHDFHGMGMDEIMEGGIVFFYSGGKRRYVPPYSGKRSELYGSGVGVPALELACGGSGVRKRSKEYED